MLKPNNNHQNTLKTVTGQDIVYCAGETVNYVLHMRAFAFEVRSLALHSPCNIGLREARELLEVFPQRSMLTFFLLSHRKYKVKR